MRQTSLKRIFTLTLALALLVALTACSKPSLEKYFDENKDAATEIETALNQGGEGVTEGTFSVEDNTATYTLKFQKTYNESQVSALKNALEQQVEADKLKYADMVKSMEEKSEIEGITFHLVYQNGDGAVIYETDITR